jgi:ADP-ribosyl-[dinitrogen reductase] hydrolase
VNQISKEDRIRAGIWGLLIADAMGVPHEFKRSNKIPKIISMIMSSDYQKTYRDVPYGTWSDDGSLTLAFADSLACKRKLDLPDFAARMVSWYTDSKYTPDGKRFDIGTTTQTAFHQIMRGVSPRESGCKEGNSQANGSLMRTLPLALWHKGSDQNLYANACEASAVTHAHPIVQAACGVYCLAARYLLIGNDDPDRDRLRKTVFHRALAVADVNFDFPSPRRGTGFVLDSLGFAIYAVENIPTYEETVFEAIRLGDDTDTTAAIAGGIVAVRDGIDAIPAEWKLSLRGFEYASKVIESFVGVCNSKV